MSSSPRIAPPAPSQPRGAMPVPAAAGGAFPDPAAGREPGHGRHIPGAGRVGNSTVGNGSLVQRPRVLVLYLITRSCGERGLGRSAACLGSAPRTPRRVSPGSGTACVCGRALAAQREPGGAGSERGASTADTPARDTVRAGDRRGGAAAGVLLPEQAVTAGSSLPAAAKPGSGPGCDSEGRSVSRLAGARPGTHGGPPGLCEAPAHPRVLSGGTQGVSARGRHRECPTGSRPLSTPQVRRKIFLSTLGGR